MVADLWKPRSGAASWDTTTAIFDPDLDRLRALIRGAGIGWAVLFVAIGPLYHLHLYGDGAIFSYAVAAQDSWAFHWHNIPCRLFVHLLTHVPAEAYVALTGDAGGGVAVYGFLFFAAPIMGLAATYAADRSPSRLVFTFACLSTACLCPLVFGFPTEMWVAHSAFWPAVAIAHCAHRRAGGAALLFLALLALGLSHEGGLVLAASIPATLLLQERTSRAFPRAAAALLAVLGVWAAVRVLLRPDAYFAHAIAPSALNFVDVTTLARGPILLIVAAVAVYLALVAALGRIAPGRCQVVSLALVAAGLIVYWLALDSPVHAEMRYYFRTAFVFATPLLGVLAGLSATVAGRPDAAHAPPLVYVRALAGRYAAARTAAGALAVVTLVHGAETVKFVSAWTDYEAAVRALATGSLSDPGLGQPGFVSADRIAGGLQALSWLSTTPYLSVLLAPGLRPSRLVVHPNGGYYWLPCKLAAAHHESGGAIPRESRRLIRLHSCLHRPH
jgi:hypothetical protein